MNFEKGSNFMKNVYFVQTNSVFGSGVKSAYLPYSIGTIAAYAWADERISNEYCLKKFIFPIDNNEQMFYNIKNSTGRTEKWLKTRKETR